MTAPNTPESAPDVNVCCSLYGYDRSKWFCMIRENGRIVEYVDGTFVEDETLKDWERAVEKAYLAGDTAQAWPLEEETNSDA